MKKIIMFTAACILLACAASCGAANEPVSVAQAFAKAFYAADFDACNKLMHDGGEFTPEKEMSGMEKAVVGALREHSKKHGYTITVDEGETNIRENTATVYLVVTAKGNPSFREEGWVEVSRDEDKWLVERYSLDRDM